jgi:hypothetical protein
VVAVEGFWKGAGAAREEVAARMAAAIAAVNFMLIVGWMR